MPLIVWAAFLKCRLRLFCYREEISESVMLCTFKNDAMFFKILSITSSKRKHMLGTEMKVYINLNQFIKNYKYEQQKDKGCRKESLRFPYHGSGAEFLFDEVRAFWLGNRVLPSNISSPLFVSCLGLVSFFCVVFYPFKWRKKRLVMCLRMVPRCEIWLAG